MERVTIYRAISFPAAAIAGLLAMIVGNSMAYLGSTLPLVAIWLGVLLLCTIINFWFLWRDAKKRGDQFFSPGMALALRAVAPLLLLSGIGTL
ncbi:MAG: hypothetical protein ABIO24_09410, partial [Saprospiraceae bacterium]